MRGAKLVAASIAVLTLLPACGSPDDPSTGGDPTPPTAEATPATPTPTAAKGSSRAAVTPPPVNAKADYQIGGAYEPAPDVRIVTRDVTAAPADGLYSICYVNAFQTQPGDTSWAGRQNLLLQERGRAVSDPDWPGEHILDTSTPAKRRQLAAVLGDSIDRCAAEGFQAVEPDNLDTYTRFPGLTRAGNLALARLLIERAHAAGLAVAQKNTAELGARGKKAGFDFAVVEECQYYKECTQFTKVYGDHVIEIEYTDVPGAAAVFRTACRERGARISVVLRDRDVVPVGTDGYQYDTC